MSDDLTVLAQLTDLHLRVGAHDGRSHRFVEAAVQAVASLTPAPNAVVITGDLVHSGATREYARLAELLEPLAPPVYPVAGNHDDYNNLVSALALPDTLCPPSLGLQYSCDLGTRQLLVCDSTELNTEDGVLGPERIRWLHEQMEQDVSRSAVIALHHPPDVAGLARVGLAGLTADDTAGLRRCCALRADTHVVAGHWHRNMAAWFPECSLWVAASVLAWDAPREDGSWIASADEPSSITLHAWSAKQGLVSHPRALSVDGPSNAS